MKRYALLYLFMLNLSVGASAQREASIWYFGNNAGLDFRSGRPVSLSNSAMSAFEGCAVLSDNNGSLLFYTNGVDVWDRNHSLMPNGTAIGGDISSTQSALIIPNPAANGIYYIFTTEAYSSTEKIGLRYTTVDLSSGNGAVTRKNDSLCAPILEKLTGIRHQNGHDYWVVAHKSNSNEFVSYLITNAGVSNTPVISAVGDVYTPYLGGTGQMKISPDGTKLAHASYNTSPGAAVYHFNSATGHVTDPVSIRYGAYGLEFSPDSRKVYIGDYAGLNQYDVSGNWDSLAIAQSRETIDTLPGSDMDIKALQLGIDGKIYGSRIATHYLSAITSPNATGRSCNLVDSVVYLGSATCSFGLPGFMQSYFANIPTTIAVSPGAFSLNIYPVPARSGTAISINGLKEPAALYLYNTTGTLVQQSPIAANGQVQLSNLPSGVYVARIAFGISHSIMKRLVIVAD